MNFLKLKKKNDLSFEQAWRLYQEAFPENEKRSLNQQLQILKSEYYHFEVIFKENEFIGIILWWNFDSLRFIDHFAVDPKHRGKGYGQLILKAFSQRTETSILLEVERPTNEINQRRIQFYKRLGFELNEYDYYMPAYKAGAEPIKLLLMSYPKILNESLINYFIKEYHPIIYKNF